MKQLIFSILVLLLGTQGFAQEYGTKGLPLPWPFPWAKDCPMDWGKMRGEYALSDKAGDDHILIRVGMVKKRGLRLVRVSKISKTGAILYDGSTYVSRDAKEISMNLSPLRAHATPVWVVIQMHYDSKTYDCAESHLVPILTLGSPDSTVSVQYRMWKL